MKSHGHVVRALSAVRHTGNYHPAAQPAGERRRGEQEEDHQGLAQARKDDEVGFNTDSRFVNLDDNENDIALDGDARPGDRVLYHFEHVVFGGIINSNGKKIDWDDGDNWTIVKRPKSMQLTKKPLTAMKHDQWAIVRRASSADEPGERASKRPRREPAAAI